MSKEVVIITESLLDALVVGKPICINGVYFVIPDNSEMRIINAVEKSLVKKYGLDGQKKK